MRTARAEKIAAKPGARRKPLPRKALRDSRLAPRAARLPSGFRPFPYSP